MRPKQGHPRVRAHLREPSLLPANTPLPTSHRVPKDLTHRLPAPSCRSYRLLPRAVAECSPRRPHPEPDAPPLERRNPKGTPPGIEFQSGEQTQTTVGSFLAPPHLGDEPCLQSRVEPGALDS